ncbi:MULTISPECIES: hypothetical protein [unclassified Lysobacter]|uniref:hypothetical protein n=1 Tax=unclassified Lysobacter TaxID=2635362 RepID=UPI001BECCF35|nr:MULTISPECIES: hypothetical protein [unclassified Lysobacter]MBT2746488.1 hypothetical protein [Lysobacter sp. ISL-42]MBT2752990.1 hypothetical protein [Lysobacter sp. ISL-50]MBT2777667.1 hypothetical protein [Lysobacter sp. ISL-54]MBT2782438.1 hypothetical protein [Lysobacter sp. ISL-52]
MRVARRHPFAEIPTMPAHFHSTVWRALAAAIALSVSLAGCLIVENPPSAGLPCDRALVGDWGLIEGEAILDSSGRAADDDFTDDDERRLRIDAQCRAHLPAKYEPRQVQLGVYKANGHRYLALPLADVAVLLTGKKGAQEVASDALRAKYPHTVSLMRYETEPGFVTLDLGNPDQLRQVVAERNARNGLSGPDAPDFLTGERRAIARQLREHPQLFEAPDRSTLYRFKRIPPAAH